MIHKYILPVIAVAALSFAVVYVLNTRKVESPTEPYASPAAKPDETGLAGSGIVEPSTQNIAVGASVPGIVTWVIPFERVGTPVKKGEVLFRLDDRQQRAELALREAMLESAKIQLERQENMPRPEEVEPIEARFREARVNLADQEEQFERARRLFSKQAMSEIDFTRRNFAVQIAQEQVRRAEADLKLIKAGAWKYDLAVSRAAVKQAEAQVLQVKTALELLEVRAPIDAELLQINVRPGEFVGAPPGQTLVLLGNVKDIHVRVDIDEHDAPRFQPGMPAVGYLRGLTNVKYPLEYVRTEHYIVPKKSLTGDNTERVDTRVLQVIYKFKTKPDDSNRVYIGQQMDVFLQKPSEQSAQRD
ncbi:MAG TPA: HlyD family efflux transporter periplasmic adaptor subunit [Gemmataceae bacterium]|nr:HlyD family efflux transporter periplasmic adaptor subunit [Gemmataceae bacterium]